MGTPWHKHAAEGRGRTLPMTGTQNWMQNRNKSLHANAAVKEQDACTNKTHAPSRSPRNMIIRHPATPHRPEHDLPLAEWTASVASGDTYVSVGGGAVWPGCVHAMSVDVDEVVAVSKHQP
ncbi:hypothetical protein C8J57DRAFT_1516225 [Mycena rebaudengoi]|nr:hypothetical protein C8J57DRAFT_1516225 [Mycena rebaudengoi]